MAQSAAYNYDIYQPRNPKASAYYKCVENHFEELERAWEEMYASRYGFWRTYVMTVIYKYLDCGELLLTEVLKNVPHRQWVFSIPKRNFF